MTDRDEMYRAFIRDRRRIVVIFTLVLTLITATLGVGLLTRPPAPDCPDGYTSREGWVSLSETSDGPGSPLLVNLCISDLND